MKIPTVLAVAGSDSIGGAGLQADIKACADAGAYAMTAVTSVTCQNTQGVSRSIAVPHDILMAQICTVIEDVRPDAVKIGMLPTLKGVKVVADILRHEHLPNVVVDPVMVATSGDELTCREAVEALSADILPQACLVTPNLPEAEVLASMPIRSVDDAVAAARAIIAQTGVGAVLVKGGHSSGTTLTDVLVEAGEEPVFVEHRRVDTRNTHGTGCTLSSAIAARMAQGRTRRQAVEEAITWLTDTLAYYADVQFGHGHGPANFGTPHCNQTNNK